MAELCNFFQIKGHVFESTLLHKFLPSMDIGCMRALLLNFVPLADAQWQMHSGRCTVADAQWQMHSGRCTKNSSFSENYAMSETISTLACFQFFLGKYLKNAKKGKFLIGHFLLSIN